MQWYLKSTKLFFSLLFILVFIGSCQLEEITSPTDTNTPADTTTPAETPSSSPLSPSTPPSPTSSIKLNIDKIIQDVLDQLSVGKILFNVPEEMKVGETERIEVRIAKIATKDFDSNLTGRGKPQVEPTKFGAETKVELVGNSFDIKGISTGWQVVGGKEPTEWSWDVTPNESGEQTLSIIVTVRVKIPDQGIDSVKNYPVEIKKIKVKINPIKSGVNFVKNNVVNLLPLIFGPASIVGIVGWVIAKRKQKKLSQSSSNLSDNQKEVDNQNATDED
jgi:hypothetical protein